VQPALARELWVKGHGHDVLLPDGYGMSVQPGQDLHVRSMLVHPGGPDENRVQRAALHSGDVDVSLK
jgi:hypothetical protein